MSDTLANVDRMLANGQSTKYEPQIMWTLTIQTPCSKGHHCCTPPASWWCARVWDEDIYQSHALNLCQHTHIAT